MNYNPFVTLKKFFASFIITGLAVAGGAGIDALIQHIQTVNQIQDVPAWINQIWLASIPMITGALRAAQNWIKNRTK